MKYTLSLAAALAAGVAIAAPPVPKDSPEYRKAKELVEQLGSKKYREREKAAAELVKMGRAAKDALNEGKKHTDTEVSDRCVQLLPQALALDLAFRVDRFLKDTDGKLDHDLPLWKAYRDQIGSNDNARKLYAEMIKANGALLDSVVEEPDRLAERISVRVVEMYQALYGNAFGGGGFRGGYSPGAMNAAELCAVMFAASQPAYKPSQPDWMLSNLYTQPTFTNPLKDVNGGAAYRKVFFHYLDARMDDNTLNQCAWVLCQYKIPGSADVLAKAIKDGKATQMYTKANAMCCLGTVGGREHVKVFEPYLKDDTVVQQGFIGRGRQGSIKVRDVALAMTIHLSGKNPKDYGFTAWTVYAGQPIQYGLLGFGQDEDRKKAFEKWAADAKSDPKKDEPKKPEPGKAEKKDGVKKE
jgi:hypothetical protein